MKTEIALLRAEVRADGVVEIDIDWNGVTTTKVYESADALKSAVASIITAPDEAVRWLLHYLIALGTPVDQLTTLVGKKLVHEVAPAVQQTIELV